MRSCLALAELAIVAGATGWTLGRLIVLRRREEAYGLSDPLGAGALGGLLGLAAGLGLCVLRAAPERPAAGRVAAWAARFLRFAGVGILEGAATGVAVAFAMARVSARNRPGGIGNQNHGP